MPEVSATDSDSEGFAHFLSLMTIEMCIGDEGDPLMGEAGFSAGSWRSSNSDYDFANPDAKRTPSHHSVTHCFLNRYICYFGLEHRFLVSFIYDPTSMSSDCS